MRVNPRDRFGQLTALEYLYTDKNKNRYWRLICDCGTECIKRQSDFVSGRIKSCGCLRRSVMKDLHIKHGERADGKSSHLYWVWVSMKERCRNPNHKRYKDYGGRGITVCKEWQTDFTTFQSWAMANGYDPTAKRGKCTIDRIDNDKGYSPDNCRWVDMGTQRQNQRRMKGETT